VIYNSRRESGGASNATFNYVLSTSQGGLAPRLRQSFDAIAYLRPTLKGLR
jgi:hypothetical protein